MTQTAAHLYDGIRSFVEESRRCIDAGDHVTLEGLDAKVGELCKSIMALPPEEAKTFAENLQQLLEEVNTLAEMLARQRDELAQALGALNLHQKANVAYKTSDMMSPKTSLDNKEE